MEKPRKSSLLKLAQLFRLPDHALRPFDYEVEGREKRRTAEIEMQNMENELKQKLLEISSK